MNLSESGRLGGIARKKALSKKRRIEIARNAGKARAAKSRHPSPKASGAKNQTK